GAGDEAVLDRDTLLHAELLHDVLHAIGAEDAQQVVFQREVEARRPRIALPARAPAKLVVDAAGLVALGPEDVQAAHGDHPLALPRAQLLEARPALPGAVLVLPGRPLELLPALLLARGDVPAARVLVVPLGGALPLLERPALGLVLALDLDVRLLCLLVGLAPGGELPVARRRSLHQHGELELREAALVLGATLVQLARDVVVALASLAPAAQRLVVARAHRLELRALGRDRARVPRLEERRLHLLLHPGVARR